MKSTLLALAVFTATALAQDTSSLSGCAVSAFLTHTRYSIANISRQKTCANNMLTPEKAKELNCKAGDDKCLCENKNFIYGLRDCAIAVCNNDNSLIMSAVQFGVTLCASKSLLEFKD